MKYFFIAVLALLVSMVASNAFWINYYENVQKTNRKLMTEASYWMGRYYDLRVEFSQLHKEKNKYVFEVVRLKQKKG